MIHTLEMFVENSGKHNVIHKYERKHCVLELRLCLTNCLNVNFEQTFLIKPIEMSEEKATALPVRDLKGLLHYCIENKSNDDNSEQNSGPHPMDEDRREWLKTALNSMTTSVVQEMLTNIEIIDNGLNSIKSTNNITDGVKSDILSAIDVLIDLTSDLDNANDFYQIGGFAVLPSLLGLDSDQIRSKTCELLSECVQNHKNCQNYALNADLLSILVKLLDTDVSENVRIKALYGISCLIRDNETAQLKFDKDLDGFQVLLRSMSANSEKDNKLRIKSSFLLTSLSSEPSVCETLFQKGFLPKIIALLGTEHDMSHEHLLATLHGMVSGHELSRVECQRKELGLKELLESKVRQLEAKPEFLEEQQFCRQILDLCFNTNPL